MDVEKETQLIDVLQTIFPDSKRNRLRKMLTQGRVVVDEKVTFKAKEIIFPGSVVIVNDKETAIKTSPPPKSKKKLPRIKILFEDEHIIVLNKQAGLLSVATDKLEPDTLHSRCVEYLKSNNEKAWAYIVHRLDRETSGVMILSKDERHKNYLQEQFANREIHRTYHALVEGKPTKTAGTIHEWLVEDKFLRVKVTSKRTPNAKEAITHWSIEDSDGTASLIHLTIETGRRHQIRVGLANLGNPVIGDEQHGATGNPIGRIALHATALELLHPETDDPIRFEAPIPFGPE